MPWTPTKDKLPEARRQVLLYSRDGDISIGHLYVDAFTDERWIYDHTFEANLDHFTHWAELPASPKEED